MEQFADAPGWTFSLQEISAGVYQVRARDRRGRTFEASGTDPDELIQRAHAYALELGPAHDDPTRRERGSG
jgi:hypothetical protein